MGYMNEFPHTRMFDSDLREILERFAAIVNIPTEFDKLKEFVENYFKNLDIQDEVNIKINELFKSGDLLYYVTPQMFGAKADGIANDTEAIVAALNTSKLVLFPKGTYLLDKIDVVGATLIGDRDAVLMASSNTNEYFISVSGCYVNGLTLNGNKNVQTASSGIAILKADNSIINNCKAKNAYFAPAVKLASNNIISNCEFNDAQTGIQIDGSNNTIQNTTTANNEAYGILLVGNVANNKINACNSVNNGSSGICSSFSNGSVASNFLVISGCYINGNKTHGLEVRTSYATITDNIVIGNGESVDNQGIVCQAADIVVSNNLVSLNSGIGIDFGNCARITCSNNKVTSNGACGIEINYTKKAVISDNTVQYNNTKDYSIAEAAGIWVHNGKIADSWTVICDDITIRNNMVETGTYQKYGVCVMDDSTDVSVIGNHLISSGNVLEIFYTIPIYAKNNKTKFSAPVVVNKDSAYDLIVDYGTDMLLLLTDTTINSLQYANTLTPNNGDKIKLISSYLMTIKDATSAEGNLRLGGSDITVQPNSLIEFTFINNGWYLTK